MSNNRDLFTYLQQNVMSHLAKNMKTVLAKQFKDVKDPVFPSVQETIEVLKEYCREHSLPYPKPIQAKPNIQDLPPIEKM